MRDGILVLNKPKEWTSSDCVAVCRRILGVKGIKKVGHGGTLDPMATGVLPVFVGQATRIMEYMDLDYKEYRCKARLGITTDTLDIWGNITYEADWKGIAADKEINEEKLREVICGFQGLIRQIPPRYSAVRIKGKRLYEYAYSGQEIKEEIKPRKAFIKDISVIAVNMEEGTFEFDVTCSKGTYIRTICSDIGEKLGCGCTMTELERTAVGNLTIDQAEFTADQVKTLKAADLEKHLLAPDYPLIYLGELSMKKDRADYFSRGNSIWWSQIKVIKDPDISALLDSGRTLKEGEIPANARGRSYRYIYKVYEEETGEFLGTGYFDREEMKLKADKVFVEKR